MRKRLISIAPQEKRPETEQWLELENLVEVEMTSEDAEYPIESALLSDQGPGWRAAASGKQIIRLIFLKPQPLRKIQLNFIETQVERTQEYVLRWSPDDGHSFQEIVRQQWNFNPRGSTSELENHEVDLAGVTILELAIAPDISGDHAIASLARLRLA